MFTEWQWSSLLVNQVLGRGVLEHWGLVGAHGEPPGSGETSHSVLRPNGSEVVLGAGGKVELAVWELGTYSCSEKILRERWFESCLGVQERNCDLERHPLQSIMVVQRPGGLKRK